MKRSPLILLAAVTFALGGCTDTDAPDESPTETTAEPTTGASPAESAETTTEAPSTQLIYYDPPAAVETEADLVLLTGAPQDFLDFVASQLDPDAGECSPIVWVYGIDPQGFAYGSIGGCGGAQLVWQRTGRAWEQVAGTQDTWLCDELTAAAVPVALLAGPQGEDVLCLSNDSAVEVYTG